MLSYTNYLKQALDEDDDDDQATSSSSGKLSASAAVDPTKDSNATKENREGTTGEMSRVPPPLPPKPALPAKPTNIVRSAPIKVERTQVRTLFNESNRRRR